MCNGAAYSASALSRAFRVSGHTSMAWYAPSLDFPPIGIAEAAHLLPGVPTPLRKTQTIGADTLLCDCPSTPPWPERRSWRAVGIASPCAKSSTRLW